MKKIKLYLDYQCYPIWTYDENGHLIDNTLPIELSGDVELEVLLDDIQRLHESRFVDTEKVFEFIDFNCQVDEDEFHQKVKSIIEIIKKKLPDDYFFEIKIDSYLKK